MKEFKGKIKWSTTKVGDTIETVDGENVEITAIHRIDWHGDREIFVHGLGIQNSKDNWKTLRKWLEETDKISNSDCVLLLDLMSDIKSGLVK